jgi:5-(carboxyamino)imidazole ribonucleotide synthase
MNPILPGSTIGIFGSGQLGRMLAIAAKSMGYRVHTYSPETDSPTGQVADLECVAPYEDTGAVEAFIRNTDVVTFEFENIDAAVADAADALDVPVHPGASVLRTAQNRIQEKSTLQNAGLPVTPFLPIMCETDLLEAESLLGFPAVLKTAAFGYDGKGQTRVGDADELRRAWHQMDRLPAVAEKYVSFEKEISVVATRGANGDYADYGAIENVHHNHILDLSLAPARVSAETAQRATQLAKSTVENLKVVGTLCVEFFVVTGGELYINEIAPRPHNSGHLTIEAAVTSQFEQHVRAICGLPLGASDLTRPAAMANLLGDLWVGGTPDWCVALTFPQVKLHLYGKHQARPGRKMGHLTTLASDVNAATETVLAARRALMAAPRVEGGDSRHGVVTGEDLFRHR